MEIVKVLRLPSGFWSVWIGSEWVDASAVSEEEAQKIADTFRNSSRRV